MKVKDAVKKLTPSKENNTEAYLKQLKAAGVDLEKDVQSQIDLLMSAIEKNEGMKSGVTITRTGPGARVSPPDPFDLLPRWMRGE